MEYKSALDYIRSDKYKKFHKERKERKAKGIALRKKQEEAHEKGQTSIDYHQSRSIMRHVNKPN